MKGLFQYPITSLNDIVDEIQMFVFKHHYQGFVSYAHNFMSKYKLLYSIKKNLLCIFKYDKLDIKKTIEY